MITYTIIMVMLTCEMETTLTQLTFHYHHILKLCMVRDPYKNIQWSLC